MRATLLKRAWRTFGQAHFVPQSRGAIVMVALLLAATNLFAMPTVSLLSGGPNPEHGIASAGFVDGDITTEAEYHTPCGVAVDLSGNYLFVADYANNAIRVLEFDINWTSTLLTLSTNGLNLVTNLFHNPIGVAIDSSYNLFVLNRGNGNNGNVLQFTIDDYLFATLVATNAANLTNAVGIALDFNDNIYVTIKSNQVLQITPLGASNIVATVTNAGASLQGLVVKYNGLLAVCDSGRNGIYLINPSSGAVTTNAGFHGAGDFINTNKNSDPISIAKFFQPSGVAETGDGSLIVTDFANNRVKVVTSTGVTNLYGIRSNYWYGPYPGLTEGDGTVKLHDTDTNNVQSRLPFGVVIAPDGSVYVTEKYWSVIRKVTGANIKPPLFPPLAPTDLAATAGYGKVFLTWTASASPGVTNYNIKRATSSGGPYINSIIGSSTTTAYADTNVADGVTYYYVVSAVSSTFGEGLNSLEASATPMFSPVPGNLVATNHNFGPVLLTWSTSAGATSYNVKRSTSINGPFTTIGSPVGTSYTDTNALIGSTYFYVVSAVNPGGESADSLEVSYTPPFPPPPPPIIGWFDYEGNDQTGYFTVLHPVGTFIAHNDLLIAVDPTTNGVSTYYITTNGPQPVLAVPSSTNGSTPPFYQNGLLFAQSLPVTIMPDLVIKAVNVGPGGSSAIVTAEFLFQVANPIITGNNAAQFTVSDITSNVVFWYTIDGTNPTNAPPSIGPIVITTNSNSATLSLNGSSNILFQVRAFRNGYSPSGIAVQSFSPGHFIANRISFGLASGEPSSKFLARPGQFFYAPVTLQLIDPSATMYSLQFNAAVTNGLTTPNKIVNGAGINFFSMLMTQVTPIEGDHYPPLDGNWYLGIPNVMFSSSLTNDPLSGTFVNTNNNLIGVAWTFRTGFKYSLVDSNGVQLLDFDTTKQDLITYSIAHDNLFKKADGVVVLGAYSFLVPTNANIGDQYFVQLGSPSATRDGAGATGADIYIQSPANSQAVTVTNVAYLVGDAAPFHWLNAGDFGNGLLDNSDVMQAFQSAVLLTDMPPTNSDLYLAMDSSGRMGVFDSLNNYYTDPGPGGNLSPAQQQAMYDGNDLSINTNAFGDGVLDVSDVYVTLRRSLDPSLWWWQRYWTNGQFVAVTTPNLAFNSNTPSLYMSKLTASAASKSAGKTTPFQQPSVSFSAGDALAAKGQTIQIPINANIFGNYPLRILGLNITIHPLDGSPALTQSVQFVPAAGLGQPQIFASKSAANYSAAWYPTGPIDSSTPGLTDNVNLGTLTVRIPANATSLSAYAIHFDHASASPNGIISFPRKTLTGLITLSSRTNSSYSDGVPDSWRLRYFFTTNNLLSQASADADGDGANNLQEYLAGTDPTDSKSFFKNIDTDQGAAQQPNDCVISWPSVSGKQYVIERSSSLVSPIWTAIATNSGTGTTMEYHDTSGGGVRYYRVRVQ